MSAHTTTRPGGVGRVSDEGDYWLAKASRIAPGLRSSSEQVHQLAGSTCFRTASMWRPQPFHVVFAQVSHDAGRHIGDPLRYTGVYRWWSI